MFSSILSANFLPTFFMALGFAYEHSVSLATFALPSKKLVNLSLRCPRVATEKFISLAMDHFERSSSELRPFLYNFSGNRARVLDLRSCHALDRLAFLSSSTHFSPTIHKTLLESQILFVSTTPPYATTRRY